jgi:hypothetical protein
MKHIFNHSPQRRARPIQGCRQLPAAAAALLVTGALACSETALPNRVLNMKYNGQPLTDGHISIQAEYAELFYRNIRYKVNE